MKQLLFIFSIISLLGCKNSKYKKISEYEEMLNSHNIYNRESYRDYKSEILKIRPTKESYCLLDSFKAELDIKKGKLNYFIGHDREYLKQTLTNLPEYLKSNYSINSIQLLIGCVVTDDDKYGKCYERLMHDAIEKKYGEDFISKSKRIVDSVYHHKNPDTIYSRFNSYGMLNRSKSKTYRNWHDSISKAFSKNFIIPKNYTVKNDSITYVSADFIINRSGHIDSLKLSSIGLSKEYENIFKSQLKNQILNNEWQSTKLYEIELNSKEFIVIFL